MDWSNKWQMQFNIEKCKVMHFGYNNQCQENTMGGEKLMMTESEKDLCVVIIQFNNTMKLEKKRVHLDLIKYFFTQRVIYYLNALPQSAVDAENIIQFKDQLNIHLYNIIRGLNKPLAFSLSPTPH